MSDEPTIPPTGPPRWYNTLPDLDRDEVAVLAALLRLSAAQPELIVGFAALPEAERLRLALAEVERLRGLLSALVATQPIQYRDGDSPHCAYCEAFLSWPDGPGYGIHEPDCPWVAARAALA